MKYYYSFFHYDIFACIDILGFLDIEVFFHDFRRRARREYDIIDANYLLYRKISLYDFKTDVGEYSWLRIIYYFFFFLR